MDYTRYMTNAQMYLADKNYYDFMENVSIARYLSDNSYDVLSLYAEGLFSFGDFTKAFEVIEDLLRLESLSSEHSYDLLYKKGVIYCRFGIFDEAIHIYECFRYVDRIDIQIKGYGNLAWVYLSKFIHESAEDKDLLLMVEENCRSALELLDFQDDAQLRKEVLLNLGSAYWYDEKFSEALEIFLQCEQLSEEVDPKVLNNIASTYVDLGKYDLAKSYLENAEIVANSVDNYYQIGVTNLILGKIAEQFYSDYSQAKDFFIVAYDNFLHDMAYIEACRCLERIYRSDYIVNKESLIGFMDKLKSQLNYKIKQEIVLHNIKKEVDIV